MTNPSLLFVIENAFLKRDFVMFRPASIFVGLRYTRSNRRHHFISLISLIAMLGIALGVTTLITVLSVLNGFDREIKKSIFSLMPPITISSVDGHIQNWQKLKKTIEHSPGITAVAPFVSGQALLQNSNSTQPLMIIGIIPADESRITSIADKITKGSFANLRSNQFGILLGENLANRLNINVGDEVTLVTPRGSLSSEHLNTNLKKFTVTGIFRAGGGGGFSYDAKLAFINLHDAQNVFGLDTAVTALHANINDIYAAPQISQQLRNQLSPIHHVSNWTDQLGEYFENIKLMKTMMFFIFVLIIVVAVFNLIGTLIMVVNNKQAEIAILRTMGATPTTIMTIFVVQGSVIGIIGTLLGVIGGVILTWYVTEIVNWIQAFFHVQLITSSVYFVDYLPSELQWADVWHISLIAILLSLLATLRPAWNAAKSEPVEGLRYE